MTEAEQRIQNDPEVIKKRTAEIQAQQAQFARADKPSGVNLTDLLGRIKRLEEQVYTLEEWAKQIRPSNTLLSRIMKLEIEMAALLQAFGHKLDLSPSVPTVPLAVPPGDNP